MDVWYKYNFMTSLIFYKFLYKILNWFSRQTPIIPNILKQNAKMSLCETSLCDIFIILCTKVSRFKTVTKFEKEALSTNVERCFPGISSETGISLRIPSDITSQIRPKNPSEIFWEIFQGSSHEVIVEFMQGIINISHRNHWRCLMRLNISISIKQLAQIRRWYSSRPLYEDCLLPFRKLTRSN